MNLTELSNILTKVYNTLGNNYIMENYISEPFEFKVNVRYGNPYEYYDYYAEIYSVPDIPEYFKYKPEVKKKLNKIGAGVDIKIIELKFKQMISYVDPDRAKKTGVLFNNRSYWNQYENS